MAHGSNTSRLWSISILAISLTVCTWTACKEKAGFYGGNDRDSKRSPGNREGNPEAKDAEDPDGEKKSKDSAADGQAGINPSDATDHGAMGSDPNGDDAKFAAKPTPPPTEDQVQKACATGPVETATQTVLFPRPAMTCAWEKDGNGPIQDKSIRARFKQDVTIKVPNNSILCNMRFSFTEQAMRYDDEIFLLYDKVVLMMSTNYADPLYYPNALRKDANGFVEYKWESLFHQRYGHELAGDYCLGAGLAGSQCSIPPTETTGKMLLGFPQDLVRKLGITVAKLKFDEASKPRDGSFNPQLNTLSFVTIGDNDGTDCIHSDFALDVTIDYVKP